MSSQEQLNPYLNRFTTLVQHHATAKLEFSCSGGKVTVNLFHDLGVVEKALPAAAVKQPENGQVWKKNMSHRLSGSKREQLKGMKRPNLRMMRQRRELKLKKPRTRS